MNLIRTVAIVLMMMTLSLSGCLGRGGGGDGIDDRVPADVDGGDENVLYIGHSFGRPFARLIEDYAHTAGIKEHTQYIEFSGGESGSPGLLWEDAEHRANIKAFLDTGEIDVLIMICCSPEFIETLDTDQAIWNFTDYAVEMNPDVRIGLAMPWKDYPAEYENASEYAANSTLDIWPYWGNLSEELSADYPGTDVFTFHHGAVMYELRAMFEDGEIDDDVRQMTGAKKSSIFTDAKGHAGYIAEDTGVYVWLHAIHGVDPMDMPRPGQYTVDIREIASKIIDEQTDA
ncbi:MAG: hypothetical protein DWC10_02610 [Candidatus Poseidoniales archaeon]|nr:MAG: hypothetical protein DWC10_02610 [Candidatus Poseidoniales archaeon]